jgi:transcription-repair coupling factor (superfamily II helicase)
MLTHLRNQLAALPEIAALADALARDHPLFPDTRFPDTLLRVAPLLAAARSPVVAALAARLRSEPPATPRVPTILFVVATSEQAFQAVSDLALWLDGGPVWHAQASELLPYEQATPDPTITGQRLEVLQLLANIGDGSDIGSGSPVNGPPVIVAPITALLQPTLPPSAWREAATHLRVEASQPQDPLLRRWIAQGYRMVAMVEERGEMARRGGIVDIWNPADPLPLRVEWFGDEIDSMRRFAPDTQRSEQRLDQAMVGPPREVAVWRSEQALTMLQQLDTRKLRAEVRDEWNAIRGQLETGSQTTIWPFLSPFFSPLASLAEYLPPGSVVLLSEADMLARSAAAWCEQAGEQRATLIAANELPPDVPHPHLEWDTMFPHHRLVLADMSNNEVPGEPVFAHIGKSPTLPAPAFAPAEHHNGQLPQLVQRITSQTVEGWDHVVVTPYVARIQELVEKAAHARRTRGSAHFVHATLTEGWQSAALQTTLSTDTEIFGWRRNRSLARRQRKARREERDGDERATFLRGLKPGEHVVHIEHGIALYKGLLRRKVSGVEREYLDLRFAAGERLYVPVDQLDRVARYVGAGETSPRLTRLGSAEWELAKRKARKAVQDLASELLDLYARRKISPGYAFQPDSEWQHELEDGFSYTETTDQIHALSEVKADMETPHPMDRLICGDVGFGKTEVALRAAFKAVQESKQVAVLVPTTVLAQQHYETFRQRMATFPVAIEMLSRFRSGREQTAILKNLINGKVDIVIGTHRLLSRDVYFKDLGLLIIDEEQRFGVRHKERLKQLRTEVDVLTLTATPIPRTLYMALSGIRDMSVIDTPPKYRQPVKTYVLPYTRKLVREAMMRELEREGQVYYLHNRVESIYRVADEVRGIVPEARVVVAHGQLEESQLEKAMMDFFNGEYDVLVCTTIIENGLDIPNVNTIIIDNAPLFGLAQLYQLRGRVGRSTRRAYAYLLYHRTKPMTNDARRRLQAIQEATEPGSGFRIAMHDMEIRGTGALLGEEQSGHIAAVGFDLYSRLLEQAITQLKKTAGQQPTDGSDQREASGSPLSHNSPSLPSSERGAEQVTRPGPGPAVDERVLVNPLITLTLPLPAYLPETYISDETTRLGVYQRMVEVQTPEGVQTLRRELRDRFGEIPPTARQLLTWLHIKVLAIQSGVVSITTTDEAFLVRLPGEAAARERLRRRFGRDSRIQIGEQFARLERSTSNNTWKETLVEMLEILAMGK